MPTVFVNGIQLHYLDEGEGEPLLLVHGLGSCSDDWEHQIPAFAHHFRVIAPSLRGFGDSDKPEGPYTISQFAQDMLALLDRLDIERAHLLGFSMGGAIAFHMALQAPGRLRTMVIVNSLPSFEMDHWSKHLWVITRIGMARLVGMPRMARFLSKRLFPEPHQRHLRRKMQERHALNDKEAYLAALSSVKGWTAAERLGEIEVPTLVIASEHDYVAVDEKAAYVEQMPDARLAVVQDSRHATHFDQADVFNRLVLDFLLAHKEQEPRAFDYRSLWRWLKPLRRRRDSADAPQ